MCDVVVKSSRSLSHLLMSSCNCRANKNVQDEYELVESRELDGILLESGFRQGRFCPNRVPILGGGNNRR